jgi:multiple sugar transport system substrate-binding protein
MAADRSVGELAKYVAMTMAVVAVSWWLFSDTIAHYRPQSGDDQGRTIRFAHFGSFQDYELWGRIIRAFEAEHPDVSVHQEYVPGWYGRYDAKMRQQILSGTTPDVAVMQLAPFGRLSKHFAEIDADALTSQLDPLAVEAFSVEDPGTEVASLRGLPVAGGNLLIYCNVECFERAKTLGGRDVQLPRSDWTLAEFAESARLTTCDFDGDGQLDQFGLWLPRWLYYLPFIWSFDARVMDDATTTWRLLGPEAEAAFDFYRDLARDHRVRPRPAEVPQLIQDVGFLTGKVAMCVNGPWFQPFLDQTRLGDSYRVYPIPSGPGGRATRVTWDALCLFDATPDTRKRSALRFMRFCVSDAAQRMIAETGRSLPSRVETLSAFDRSGSDPRRHAFVEALAYSRLQPDLPRFRQIDRAIGRRLYRFIADDNTQTAAEFLDELSRDSAVVDAFESAGRVAP